MADQNTVATMLQMADWARDGDGDDMVIDDLASVEEGSDWDQILQHVPTRYRAQARALVACKYRDVYYTWCYGQKLVLDPKMQLCFFTQSRCATWLRKQLATRACFDGDMVTTIVNVHIEAGAPLYELQKALEKHSAGLFHASQWWMAAVVEAPSASTKETPARPSPTATGA